MGNEKEVVILGAGAVGRYVSHVLSLIPDVKIAGFTDHNSDLWGTEIDGHPVLGSDDKVRDLYVSGVRHAIIGVATPEIRRKMYQFAKQEGFELLNAIHPSAIIPPDVQLGESIIIAAGTIMSHNPIIEDNTWLGLGVVVGHDTCIGRDSQIGGRAAIGADVTVGEGVLLGFGCVIGREVNIGNEAIVGSGTNVVRDVPARTVVVGNPAKVLRYRDA